jgi:hypothetical protein
MSNCSSFVVCVFIAHEHVYQLIAWQHWGGHGEQGDFIGLLSVFHKVCRQKRVKSVCLIN